MARGPVTFPLLSIPLANVGKLPVLIYASWWKSGINIYQDFFPVIPKHILTRC